MFFYMFDSNRAMPVISGKVGDTLYIIIMNDRRITTTRSSLDHAKTFFFSDVGV